MARQCAEWDRQHLIGVVKQVPTPITPKDARLQRCSPEHAEETADHTSDAEIENRRSHGQIFSGTYTKGLAAALEIFGGSTAAAGWNPESMSGKSLPLFAPAPLDGREGPELRTPSCPLRSSVSH